MLLTIATFFIEKFGGLVSPLDSSSTTEPSSTTMASISMGTVSSFTVTATTTGGGGGPLGGDQILEYILIGAGCGIGLLLCLISTLCIGLICYKCSVKTSESSLPTIKMK